MLNPEFYISEPEQHIFLTGPSELLSELPLNEAQYLSPDPNGAISKDLFNNSPQTDGKAHDDSAKKARRRATAKSVGFIPTDPYVIRIYKATFFLSPIYLL